MRSARSERFRLGVGTLGLTLLLVDVFADALLGNVFSLGRIQILLAVPAVLLCLYGATGYSWSEIYQNLGINLLGVVILLGLVESAASLLHASTAPTDYATIPYYARQEWGARYWADHGNSRIQYHPYVGWRSAPIASETLNVDASSLRRTPGATCTAEAFTLFTFGGSTLWGFGSPDWLTIPALLQARLGEVLNRPVCVVNLGEIGHQSSQELVQLGLEISADSVPDAVLFYDGLNDVGMAHEMGAPIVHRYVPEFTQRIDLRKVSLLEVLRDSHTSRVLQSLLPPGGSPRRLAPRRAAVTAPFEPGIDETALAEGIVSAYFARHRQATALADQYGFRLFAFWQPVSAYTKKPLTAEEDAHLRELDQVGPATRSLYRAVYEVVDRRARETPFLHSLVDAFDDESSQIYIDNWFHTTPAGNRIIAERMLDVMRHEGLGPAAGFLADDVPPPSAPGNRRRVP